MLPDRFWGKVEKTSTCWLWLGATSNGYGQFGINGKLKYVHRLSYEEAVGAIPDGLTLDHLCRVHQCLNPAHLEPVEERENILRGEGVTARNARKSHCKRGHPLSGDNLKVVKLGRECRICRRAIDAQFRSRRRSQP